MKEIEVGDYVRTKKGIARIVEDGKFVEIRENGNRMYYVDTNGTPCTWEFSCYIWSKDIAKHSKNIIDLIEVGDYVNGYKVIGVTLDPAPSGKCVDIDCNKPSYESYLFEEQIYSIVTHQQFASMEYKIED